MCISASSSGGQFDARRGHAASMVRVDAAANPPDDLDDARALARHAAALLAAMDAALAGWVTRCVLQRWADHTRSRPPATLVAAAEEAGRQAQVAVVPVLERLLASDVDEQWTSPLAVVRGAVALPTQVLASAGVPPVERDPQAQAMFPDDVYDLTPASFADLGPEVAEPALVWGAAKAHVILRRRRSSR